MQVIAFDAAPTERASSVVELPGTPAAAVLTSALAGDVRPGSVCGEERRAAVLADPWLWTSQVHGSRVIDATDVVPKGSRRPFEAEPADALMSRGVSAPLAMFSADCALVALASPEGVIGIAHCGWRGLGAGVVQSLARSMRSVGARSLVGLRGPCIGPECYEFGESDLLRLTRRYGDAVASVTSAGRPALDLPAAVERAADEAGVETLIVVEGCTACSPGWFSYRARGENTRQCVVVTTLT